MATIEEERKAFEEHYKVAARGAYDEPDLYFKDGEFRCAVTQRSFNIWLAAKEHAAEMAKPTCIVFETMADTFTVQYFDNGRPTQESGFKNEVVAIQWAKNNGYRVIE